MKNKKGIGLKLQHVVMKRMCCVFLLAVVGAYPFAAKGGPAVSLLQSRNVPAEKAGLTKREKRPRTTETAQRSSYEIPRLTVRRSEQILTREGYTTSYNAQTKQANWVAWHLTREHTEGAFRRKGVPYYDADGQAVGIGRVDKETVRGCYFVDRSVKRPRQEHSDWSGAKKQNLNHGHLCPAADNRWSKKAMNQSFLLTNMCPQDIDLNAGDWEKLERRCRGWAKHYGDVYIAAGPVFYGRSRQTMGKNRIAVPDAFFKVVLCMKGKPKALGFIYPNDGTPHPMEHYVMAVDEVERVTGIDFFAQLPDNIERTVEATADLRKW